MREVQLLKGKL